MEINRKYVQDLLAGMSERTIAFPPAYARITGKMTAGVALAQLVYWWATKGGQWLHKTDAEVCAETALTADEWVGAKKLLKASGFVSIELRGLPAKSHYFIHIDKITDAIVELQDSGISRNKIRDGKSGAQDSGISGTQIREFPETCSGDSPKHSYIVEITTENTTESTDAPAHFADARKEFKKYSWQNPPLVAEGESGKEITGPDAPKSKKPKTPRTKWLTPEEQFPAENNGPAGGWSARTSVEVFAEWFATQNHPELDPALIYADMQAWAVNRGSETVKKAGGYDWRLVPGSWMRRDEKQRAKWVRKATETVAQQAKMAREAGHTITLKEEWAAKYAEMKANEAAKKAGAYLD
jgi:hypothetical protein